MDFIKITNKLLNNSHLVVKDIKYDIVEIEIYFHGHGHPDIYTHCHPEQLNQCYWYFHRTSKSDKAKYKSGTHKGLDFTVGDINNNVFFGILIRSINLGNRLIEGPSKCVDEILSITDYESIDQFAKKESMDVKGNKILTIIPKDVPTDKVVYKSPRVGINLKNKKMIDKKYHFVEKHYRYFTEPTLKKGKNLIIYALCLDQLKNVDYIVDDDLIDDIRKMCKSTKKYIKDICQIIIDNKSTSKKEDIIKNYGSKTLKSKELIEMMTKIHFN